MVMLTFYQSQKKKVVPEVFAMLEFLEYIVITQKRWYNSVV